MPEQQQPMRALALVEHVDRELDLLCLVRSLLSRHNIELEIASFYLDAPVLLAGEAPRAVFTPFFYASSDWLLKDYVSAWPNARFSNLAWEQVFYPSHQALKAPRGTFAQTKVTHLAWSQNYIDYMLERHVRPANTRLVGHALLRLYRPPYQDYFPSRAELATQFRLDPDKRWVFVPENYRWAFLSDKKLTKIRGHGVGDEELDRMRGFCQRTLAELIGWCNRLARKGDVEVIFRPRPAISTKQIVDVCAETLGKERRRFRVIKGGTAREWVLASDVVASSFSTVLIEAAVAGKTILKIEPEPIPDGLHYDWCDLVPPTRTAAKFMKTCADPEPGRNAKRLQRWAEEMFFPTGDPVRALVKAMAVEIRQAYAKDLPQVTGEHGFQMSPELKAIAPGLSPLERRNTFRKQVEGFSFPGTTHEKDLFGREEVEARTRRWAEVLGAPPGGRRLSAYRSRASLSPMFEWSPTPIPAWTEAPFDPPSRIKAGGGSGKDAILVLGLERTGSTSALKFLRANFKDTHALDRQHGVSPRFRDFIRRGAAMGVDDFDQKEARLDGALEEIGQAGEVLVIVGLREPLARVISLFLYRNRDRMLDYFDADAGRFRCADEIAADLETLAWSEAVRQRHWFDEELTAAFGFDLLKAEGPVRNGPCTFTVVRCEHASTELMDAVASLGPVNHPPKVRNGFQQQHAGQEDLALAAAAAFRRQFIFSKPLTEALWDSPCLRRYYEPAAAAGAV